MDICMCSRGNVRSVTLAAFLKDYLGLTGVITCGLDTIGGALRWLCSAPPSYMPTIWVIGEADLLARVQQTIAAYAPVLIRHIDVGPDIWMSPMHPGLMTAIVTVLKAQSYIDLTPRGPYPTIEDYLAANEAAYYRHRAD